MNIRRTKAFFRIKANIVASKNLDHIEACKMMITVANGLLDKQEIIDLKEYLKAKEKEFAPVENDKQYDGVYADCE